MKQSKASRLEGERKAVRLDCTGGLNLLPASTSNLRRDSRCVADDFLSCIQTAPLSETLVPFELAG